MTISSFNKAYAGIGYYMPDVQAASLLTPLHTCCLFNSTRRSDLAIQSLNTMVMMQQLKQIDQKLDATVNTVNKAIVRIEESHPDEPLSAAAIFDEEYRQYEIEDA